MPFSARFNDWPPRTMYIHILKMIKVNYLRQLCYIMKKVISNKHQTHAKINKNAENVNGREKGT